MTCDICRCEWLADDYCCDDCANVCPRCVEIIEWVVYLLTDQLRIDGRTSIALLSAAIGELAFAAKEAL